MKRRMTLAAAACAIVATGPALATGPLLPFQHRDPLPSDREEVYVFRTQRTEHLRGATADCAAARFESAAQDHYTLWSLASAHRSARIKDAHVRQVGEFRACFGASSSGRPFGMFATGTIGDIPWSGYGECSPVVAQPPEPKVRAYTCNLTIDGLPAGYAGGWFASSTVAPQLGTNAPADAQVAGFLSMSVVTLRLWRAPPEH
jgi:hypothetical protein